MCTRTQSVGSECEASNDDFTSHAEWRKVTSNIYMIRLPIEALKGRTSSVYCGLCLDLAILEHSGSPHDSIPLYYTTQACTYNVTTTEQTTSRLMLVTLSIYFILWLFITKRHIYHLHMYYYYYYYYYYHSIISVCLLSNSVTSWYNAGSIRHLNLALAVPKNLNCHPITIP